MKEKNEDAKIVWIIGAGASFGNFLMPQSDTGQQQLTYPLINDIFDLFHSYWRTKSYGIRRHNYKFLNQYIRTYFRKILLYDGKRSSKINLNAEDVYTFLDIAIENKPKPYRLLDYRREFHLMLLKLFTALESHRMSLKLEPPHYCHLVDTLSDYDTIITFNWDLLLDFQLDRTTQYNNTVIMSKRSKGEMNYGTRPYPIEYEDYNTKIEVYFLKIHGSVI